MQWILLLLLLQTMICTTSYLFETFHAMMSMISLYNLDSLIHEQY